MDEQRNNNLGDKVVSDIQKDFKLVGKQRVHSWYAWAIVGIVFGMALGIIYVANRSAQFSASQAALVSAGGYTRLTNLTDKLQNYEATISPIVTARLTLGSPSIIGGTTATTQQIQMFSLSSLAAWTDLYADLDEAAATNQDFELVVNPGTVNEVTFTQMDLLTGGGTGPTPTYSNTTDPEKEDKTVNDGLCNCIGQKTALYSISCTPPGKPYIVIGEKDADINPGKAVYGGTERTYTESDVQVYYPITADEGTVEPKKECSVKANNCVANDVCKNPTKDTYPAAGDATGASASTGRTCTATIKPSSISTGVAQCK